jgi:hypothetical protein
MLSDNTRLNPARGEGVFAPEDLSILRVALDVAWNGLALKSRTTDNREVLAARILRLATNGNRDPIRLAAEAAQTIEREASHGVL